SRMPQHRLTDLLPPPSAPALGDFTLDKIAGALHCGLAGAVIPRLAEMAGQAPEAAIALARHFHARGRLGEALRYARLAPEADLLLADCLMRTGQRAEAAGLLRSGIVGPDHNLALANLTEDWSEYLS